MEATKQRARESSGMAARDPAFLMQSRQDTEEFCNVAWGFRRPISPAEPLEFAAASTQFVAEACADAAKVVIPLPRKLDVGAGAAAPSLNQKPVFLAGELK